MYFSDSTAEDFADYEIEMRTDPRICKIFGLQILPGKSTIQRGLAQTKMDLLRTINSILLQDWMKRKLNIILDASGIRIVGRSIWYSIRTKSQFPDENVIKFTLLFAVLFMSFLIGLSQKEKDMTLLFSKDC